MGVLNDEFSGLKISRQERYRLRQKAKGNCIVCGKPAVTANHCKAHQDRVNAANGERARDKRAENPRPRGRRKSKLPEVYHDVFGRGIVVLTHPDGRVVVDFDGERRTILAQFLRLL